jgi:hypothetical protein
VERSKNERKYNGRSGMSVLIKNIKKNEPQNRDEKERFPNTRGKERRLSGENLYNKISWTLE